MVIRLIKTNVKKTSVIDNHVKKYRKACGLTQGDIACLLGFKTSNQICRIEQGRLMPRTEIAFALSLILGQPIKRLYPSMFGKVTTKIRQNADHRCQKLKTPQPCASKLYRHRYGTLKQLINNQFSS